MAHTFKVAMRTVAFGCAAVLTNKYVTSFVVCTGPSMKPTLQSGNIIVTEQISPRLGLIDVGDVVVAKSPQDDETRVCKRVAAKSGDLVLFNDHVYRIPAGHVWLLGDNKSNSNDSRNYGPVRLDKIKARCLFRVWPDINHSILHESQPPRVSKYSPPKEQDANSDDVTLSVAKRIREYRSRVVGIFFPPPAGPSAARNSTPQHSTPQQEKEQFRKFPNRWDRAPPPPPHQNKDNSTSSVNQSSVTGSGWMDWLNLKFAGFGFGESTASTKSD